MKELPVAAKANLKVLHQNVQEAQHTLQVYIQALADALEIPAGSNMNFNTLEFDEPDANPQKPGLGA